MADKTSKAAWKRAAVHNILLPSGVRVDVKIVDLPHMVETGSFPQHLLDVALKEAATAGGGEAPTPTIELIQQQREFTDLLVMSAVVDPKLEPADMEHIPFEDKALIVDIATRQRDYDAEGVQIAGLDSSARWRKFRGFPDLNEDVEGS
jgi:hypothetical protein